VDRQKFDLSQRPIIVVKRLPTVNQAAFVPEDLQQGTHWEKQDAGKWMTLWLVKKSMRRRGIVTVECRSNNFNAKTPGRRGARKYQESSLDFAFFLFLASRRHCVFALKFPSISCDPTVHPANWVHRAGSQHENGDESIPFKADTQGTGSIIRTASHQSA
jgi:hypothetical protein